MLYQAGDIISSQSENGPVSFWMIKEIVKASNKTLFTLLAIGKSRKERAVFLQSMKNKNRDVKTVKEMDIAGFSTFVVDFSWINGQNIELLCRTERDEEEKGET